MAGSFALAAFAVAIVSGLAGENPASHVLSRAIIAMLLCYPVGLIVGMVCERIIADRVREHAREIEESAIAPDAPAPARGADDEEVITT